MGQFDQTAFDQTAFDQTATVTTQPVDPDPAYRVFAQSGAATSSTYGQLRLRLTKAFPGIDLDLIDGWIGDRYTEVLDEMPWQRTEKSAAVPAVAEYAVGTVALAPAGVDVTLDGGVFAASATGRSFRIAGDDEYYEFTQTTETTGVLDRPYAGAGGTGLGYSLFQTVYQLPADLRILGSVRVLSLPHPLERRSLGDLNAMAASRPVTGIPLFYAPYMDDSSTPPRMQMETYPACDATAATAFVVTYTAEAATLGVSSAALAPWIRPSVLYEGVRASALAHEKDYAGSAGAEQYFRMLLKQMRNAENVRRPPVQMKMASRFTRYRYGVTERGGGVRLP